MKVSCIFCCCLFGTDLSRSVSLGRAGSRATGAVTLTVTWGDWENAGRAYFKIQAYIWILSVWLLSVESVRG
jgi:hypothetical protein